MGRSAVPLRVGVVGVGRGLALAEHAGSAIGIELVAICDRHEARLAAAVAHLGVRGHGDLESLLADDVDAVVLANDFHQHAPLAIRCLDGGRHVLSETTACMTLAEGVALTRAVERSGRSYLLAENFAFTAGTLDLRRRFAAGEVGRFVYGEGEYVHPLSAVEWNGYAPGPDHWRNWLPFICYSSHALAPILSVTEDRPVSVAGFDLPWHPDDPGLAGTDRRGGVGGLAVVTMASGAVVKLLQATMAGGRVVTRIHGTDGAMEVSREGGHEDSERTMLRHFVDVVAGREQPLFGVHRSVAIAAVGGQAYRSILAGGQPMEIPNLSDPSEQEAHVTDDWTPRAPSMGST